MPNSSSCSPKGVFFSSLSASTKDDWIFPICVEGPVRTTNAIPDPLVTKHPENSMDVWSCIGTVLISSVESLPPLICASLRPSSPGNLPTLSLSPVKLLCSTYIVDDLNDTNRASAGIESPTRNRMTSPGTSCVAS